MKKKNSIYERLAAEGRAMTGEQIEDSLRSLAADPRFAAVVGWLENNRNVFTVTGSGQGIAERHGCLAHCMGSVHAIHLLEGQLRNVIEPRPEPVKRARED